MGLPFVYRVPALSVELYEFSVALGLLPLVSVSLTEHFVQEEIDLLLFWLAADLIA